MVVSNGKLSADSDLNLFCMHDTISVTNTDTDRDEPSDTADENIIPSCFGIPACS